MGWDEGAMISVPPSSSSPLMGEVRRALARGGGGAAPGSELSGSTISTPPDPDLAVRPTLPIKGRDEGWRGPRSSNRETNLPRHNAGEVRIQAQAHSVADADAVGQAGAGLDQAAVFKAAGQARIAGCGAPLGHIGQGAL